MKDYKAHEIEERWIEFWEKTKEFEFKDDLREEKMYILDMFPYPSGSGLHVGHLKGYLATDIWARYLTMNGYMVFHPMGWDAFGLPAEQYAIKTGNSPNSFTQKNIENFRKQLKRLCLSYDFSREINTSDPDYYRQTQWIFSQMYKHGLAELRNTQVNWCEELNTVLADEEIVEKDGVRVSERGEYPVEKKLMNQWVLRITDYAEDLLSEIEDLEWPDNIKKIQETWIGKRMIYRFYFTCGDKEYFINLKYASSIRRLRGVGIHEFSSLGKEMNLTEKIAGNRESLGITMTNRFNNETVNLCFLHNAESFSDDLIPIFEGGNEDDFYDPEIEEYYLKRYLFQPTPVYKLKDWVFSRQRYWGEPIPILHGENGEIVLEEDLPLILPEEVDYRTKREGQSPLVNDSKWVNVSKGGKKYRRETNTMPNWAGSSWYFIAFLLKKPEGGYHDLDSKEAKDILERWLPVDIYVGGQEHATMHLLYARFWHKFLERLGIVKCKEPFKTLFNQGLVLGNDGSKMSKSKGNYVSIDEMIEKYSSDALRLYSAFSGPTCLSFKWEENDIKASQKWLYRVYSFFKDIDKYKLNESDEGIMREENILIDKVSHAIPCLKINLGVSAMMIFLNYISDRGTYTEKSIHTFVKILSFYAPALAEEVWRNILNQKDSLFRSKWPKSNDINFILDLQYKVFLDGKFKIMLNVPNLEAIDDSYIKRLAKEKLGKKHDLKGAEFVIKSERKIILISRRK